MKKRKQKNQLKINNESTTHYDLDDVQIQELHNIHQTNTQKLQKNGKEDSILEQEKEQPPSDDKTCAQTLKEKLQFFWVQMINYLQFDQVFSNEKIQLLKKENYTIKTRYPDNYYLTYQQRSKTFGISIEEITRIKLQEQQIKNKNFWNELKRFICCQGGNELQENDEMLTAVSQSEYFYLNKAKNKHKNSIQMTQQNLIEKPFNKMSRQENYNQKQINEKSSFNKQEKSNIFYQDNQTKENKNRDFLEVGHNKNIKQIDMNNVKSIKKQKQSHKKQEIEEKLKNNQKINDSKNQKSIKDTEVIYIHKKETINSNSQQKQQKINDQHLQKNDIKNQNKHDQIDQVFMSNRNSKNINQEDKQNLTSQKSNPKNENEKPVDLQHQIKNNQKSKQSKAQQSTNPSSPNPSLQKLIPHIDNFDNPQINFQGKTSEKPHENINFSQIDNSDMISVAQSENKQITMSKKQKRNKSKIPKQEHFLNLQVIQKVEDNQNQLNNLEDNVDNQLGMKKYSLSSQQLNKKSKKRPFNVEKFNQTVDQGLEEDLQQSFNMEFGGDKNNTVNESINSIQISKKRKARNKKLFNLQEENEKTDEIIIYDENQQKYEQQSPNQSKIYAQTIDVGSNMGAHGTSNIKKRKKAKKIKEADIENDDYNAIVIEGEQNVESEINNQTDKLKNFSTIDLPTHQNSLSPPMKADKKRKKKTRLREQIQKEHQQFDIVDLGEIN